MTGRPGRFSVELLAALLTLGPWLLPVEALSQDGGTGVYGPTAEWAPEVYECEPASAGEFGSVRTGAPRSWQLPPNTQSVIVPPGEPLPSLDPEVIVVPNPLDLAPEPMLSEDAPASPSCSPCDVFHPLRWAWTTRRASADQGIGYERVATAPFVLDIARPMSQQALRVDVASGWGHPDRAEALWARIGTRGPRWPERAVDYQDVVYLAELGTPTFSVRTLVPLRMLNPEINGNTAGMGDMQLVTKIAMLNGETWKITQVNDFTFNTGAVKKGLGTGHISIAPGLLAGYQWNDETYLHGQLKFQFPIAGDPLFAGEILHWGFGLSHLLYDSDSFAVIPTVEAVFHSILTGQETPFGVPLPQPVDGVTISTLHVGARTVRDIGRDFGLVEFGVSAGFNLGSSGWYDSLVRIECRILR